MSKHRHIYLPLCGVAIAACIVLSFVVRTPQAEMTIKTVVRDCAAKTGCVDRPISAIVHLRRAGDPNKSKQHATDEHGQVTIQLYPGRYVVTAVAENGRKSGTEHVPVDQSNTPAVTIRLRDTGKEIPRRFRRL